MVNLSTKAAVDRLFRVDSAIRESIRLSNVAMTALARDVVSSKLNLGNGIQVPRGVHMVFPTQPIHQGPRYYEDPLHFDPFRFSRRFEGAADPIGRRASGQESITSITDSFLAFGHGKHACPGRWFAAQTMKQALATILLNFDVEVARKPAKRQVLLNMMVLATDVRLRIRRKL